MTRSAAGPPRGAAPRPAGPPRPPGLRRPLRAPLGDRQATGGVAAGRSLRAPGSSRALAEREARAGDRPAVALRDGRGDRVTALLHAVDVAEVQTDELARQRGDRLHRPA